MTASPRFGVQLELLPCEWLYDLTAHNPRRLAELTFYTRRVLEPDITALRSGVSARIPAASLTDYRPERFTSTETVLRSHE